MGVSDDGPFSEAFTYVLIRNELNEQLPNKLLVVFENLNTPRKDKPYLKVMYSFLDISIRTCCCCMGWLYTIANRGLSGKLVNSESHAKSAVSNSWSYQFVTLPPWLINLTIFVCANLSFCILQDRGKIGYAY